MSGPLTLALLALGPIKAGLSPSPAVGLLPPLIPRPTSAALPATDVRDPIASLAEEWLLKR